MNNKETEKETPPVTVLEKEKEMEETPEEKIEASPEMTEEQLAEVATEAMSEIHTESKKVIVSADERIEKVESSISLSPEKEKAIYEGGGFGEKVEGVKEEIVQLSKATKESVELLEAGDTNKEKTDKARLREFSKKHSPEERKQAAQEIVEKRKEYFEAKGNLSKRIENTREKAERKELEATEVAAEVQKIEQELADKKNSLISRFLKHFEIKSTEAELADKKNLLEKCINEQAIINAELESLEEITVDRKSFEKTRQILNEFYKGQEVEWNKYEQNLKERDLADVIKKYDVFSIHSIDASPVQMQRSTMRPGASWEDKVKIILSLEPALATSTIKKGASGNEFWTGKGAGVILNRGLIREAHNYDAGSEARGLKERISGKNFSDLNNFKSLNAAEEIRSAIERKLRYNELLVEEPKIAGIFLNLMEEEDALLNRTKEEKMPEMKQVYLLAQETGLSVYSFIKGRFYETIYDEQKNKFKPDFNKELTPEDAVEKTVEIPKEKKQEIKDKVLAEMPFRFEGFEDLDNFSSEVFGRMSYVELNGLKKAEKFNVEDIIEIEGAAREKRHYKKIAEYNLGGRDVKYLIDEEGKLIKRESIVNGAEAESREISGVGRIETSRGNFGSYREMMRLGWVYKTSDYERQEPPEKVFFRKELEENRFYETSQYLSCVEDQVSEYIKKSKDEPEHGAAYEKILRSLAFHLYGFSQQAEILGDDGARIRAFDLAKKIVKPEEYYQFITDRVDAQGKFKFREADLKHIKSGPVR